MQKYLVHLKPKDCYFLGIKRKKIRSFYIVVFYSFSLFKMFM